eukprot:1380651-Amorphochlora_amoeboformis.AAC.1
MLKAEGTGVHNPGLSDSKSQQDSSSKSQQDSSSILAPRIKGLCGTSFQDFGDEVRDGDGVGDGVLSLIHISEPTRPISI